MGADFEMIMWRPADALVVDRLSRPQYGSAPSSCL